MKVRMSSLRLSCASGLFVFLAGCGNATDNQDQQQPDPRVTVLAVQPVDADLIQAYPGRVRGAREVQVRARVSGILLERAYQEGARVEQGDLLFRIDPEPMRLQVKQAEAALANARAELQQAERDWKRAEQLFERGALSASDKDRARSQLDFARAGMAEVDARLDEAQLNLSYTEVRAPVSGVTSLEAQSEGSLIEVGSLLTTLVQQDPVHVIFALPEKDALIQRAARLEDTTLNGSASLLLADGSEYPLPGNVDFTSSSIDSATGSVTLRAVFDNPERQLIPGQFVRVRLVLARFRDRIMLPAEAIGANSRGSQVMVVNADSSVESRTVELGRVLGDRQIINSGVEQGERVVVNGLVGLMPGTRVQVVDGDNRAADHGE